MKGSCNIRDWMRSKKEVEGEMQNIKKQIHTLESEQQKNDQIKEIMEEKVKAEDTSSGLLAIVKLVVEENRKTSLILKSISDNLARLEMELDGEEGYGQDDHDQNAFNVAENERAPRVQPVSGLDAKVLQFVQVKNIACAEDVRKAMGYRGKNAASSRLNRLFKLGFLERYQLGHTVYYKYDAQRMANALIVSPPQ